MPETTYTKESDLRPAKAGFYLNPTNTVIDDVREEAPKMYDLLVVEGDIVQKQKDNLTHELELMEQWDLLEPYDPKKGDLNKFVDPRIEFFLRSCCREGEILVPCNGRLNPNFHQAVSAIEDLHPISPILFQESVVEKVFDVDFEEKEGTPERLRERQKYFNHLRQIVHHLQSLWAANPKKKDPRKPRRMFVIGFKEHEARGKMMVYRKDRGRYIALVYDNIFDLSRGNIHTQQNYRGRYSRDEIVSMGELERMRAIRQMIRDRINFYQRWKFTSAKERQMHEKEIAALHEELEQVTNEYKSKAKGQFEACLDIMDSIGKVNIPSKSARMVGAENQILKRNSEVRGIARNVDNDQEFLRKSIDDLQQQYNLITLKIATFFTKDVFKKSETNPSRIRVGIKKALEEYEDLLNGPFAQLLGFEADLTLPEPYASWTKAALSNFRTAGKLLQTLNYKNERGGMLILPNQVVEMRDKAMLYAIKGHCLLRYAFIQKDLADLLEDVTKSPEFTTPMVIEDRIENILNRYRPHASGNKYLLRDDLEFTDEGYNEISDHLQGIKQIVLDWYEAKTKMYEEGAQIIAESDDRDQAVLDLDDRILDLEHDFLQQVQECVKAFDFKGPRDGISVDNVQKEFETAMEESGFEYDNNLRRHLAPIDTLPTKLF